MATVLEDYTTEEQSSVVRFLCAKVLNAKDIYKEAILVYGGKCLQRKQLPTVSRNSLKDFRRLQLMPDRVFKWLRQQSNDFYAAGFDALVKRWDKCINPDGGYVEKQSFLFSNFE
jgi:hypothetical protein